MQNQPSPSPSPQPEKNLPPALEKKFINLLSANQFEKAFHLANCAENPSHRQHLLATLLLEHAKNQNLPAIQDLLPRLSTSPNYDLILETAITFLATTSPSSSTELLKLFHSPSVRQRVESYLQKRELPSN